MRRRNNGAHDGRTEIESLRRYARRHLEAVRRHNGKDGEAQSRGQGENRHLPPAFCQQAAASGDVELLQDVWIVIK